MTNVATLPVASDSSAPLPQRYEAARAAIAECEQIDECKTWSDKAAALASYARQAKDDSLRVMAVRIQARAERRCGELLKQIPSGSEENLVQHRRDGTVPSVTRTQAATEAGLSERQRKTALRIATIPVEQFDYAVESQDPPTVTALATLGTRPQPEREEPSIPDQPGIEDDIWTDADEDAACEAFEKEYAASIDKIMEADDRMSAAHAEIKRQAAEITNLKISRDGFMNGKSAIVQLLKAEQRKTDRLNKQVEKLQDENEALRERIAIMEVG